MDNPKLIDVVDVKNILGEGVLWNAAQQTVWWTDIERRVLYIYAPDTGSLEAIILPERLGSFCFTDQMDVILAAFESGFSRYNIRTGDHRWIARPEEKVNYTRFNDGRIDRQGRFWAGTMVEGVMPENAPKGRLYCLDETLNISVHEQDILIPNSLCWSPEGDVMYFADSPENQIYAYDFDAEKGNISNKRVFVTTDIDIHPDGSIVDAEGYLWNAQWGGGRVVRYHPEGRVDLILDLSVSQPTCVAFGGRDMNLIFVTTARADLSAEQLKAQPHAGNLLIYKTNYIGIQDCVYKIGRGLQY